MHTEEFLDTSNLEADLVPFRTAWCAYISHGTTSFLAEILRALASFFLSHFSIYLFAVFFSFRTLLMTRKWILLSAERKTSLGKDWHPLCLKCVQCNKTLTPGGHAEVCSCAFSLLLFFRWKVFPWKRLFVAHRSGPIVVPTSGLPAALPWDRGDRMQDFGDLVTHHWMSGQCWRALEEVFYHLLNNILNRISKNSRDFSKDRQRIFDNLFACSMRVSHTVIIRATRPSLVQEVNSGSFCF